MAGSRDSMPGAAREVVPLFREEALRQRHGFSPGEGSRLPPPSAWVVGALGLTLVAALAALVFFGHYTASDSVRGFVTAASGTVRVYAPRRGIARHVHAREGDRVVAGQPLVTGMSERRTQAANVDVAVVESLERELEVLRERVTRADQMAPRELARARRQLLQATERLRLVDGKRRTAADSLALRRSQFDRLDVLVRHGQLPVAQLEQSRAAVLAAETEAAAAALDHAAGQVQVSEARHALDALPLALADRRAELDAEVLALTRRLHEARAGAAFVIAAPIAGEMASISARPGALLEPARSVAILRPAGGLRVVLLVPNRAIGFVEPGDRVRIHVDAFPSRRHGALAGVVERVADAPVTAVEGGAPAPIAEGGYRVEVRLETAAAAAHLKPGMTVTADVLRERRRIVDWLLEPARRLLQADP